MTIKHGLGKLLMRLVMSRLNLSAQVFHRILKVARTTAGLQAAPDVLKQHLSGTVPCPGTSV